MSNRLTMSVSLAALATLVTTRASAQPTQAPIFIAEIDRFTLDPGCNDDFCGATLVAAGETVILPANLLIDLPANRLSAQQIFAQAPAACVAAGESGLAKADTCAGGRGGWVTLAANRSTCGALVAGDVFIQKDLTSLVGDVTFINYDEGWFRLDGAIGDPQSGTMVRVNDPSETHTLQVGAGCDGGPNCSADPRFTNDPVNYTTGFISGYPLCIPSSVVPTDAAGAFTSARRVGADSVTGEGDAFCPTSNRPTAPSGAGPVAADSRLFAPLMIGDNIFVSGNFETIAGVTFLSAHTAQVNVGLMTRDDPTQPDYLQILETVWDMPSFNVNRARFRALGTGTLPGTTNAGQGNDLDLYAVRVDPTDGSNHFDPIGSTFNNPGTKGLGNRPLGVNLWRLTYNVSFPPLPLKPNDPCSNLRNAGLLVGAAANKCREGGTVEENFAVLSPLSREVFSRTRHKVAAIAAAAQPNGPPVPEALNILGSAANQGEYLRPLGLSLGGIESPVAVEFDLGLAAQPFVFEGLPWLLDRRVSPTGCRKTGCEPLSTFPIGTLAVAPFPHSGRSPDQVLSNIAGAPTIVPVPGRPATFFRFDPTTGGLLTALIPVPVDTTCPAIALGGLLLLFGARRRRWASWRRARLLQALGVAALFAAVSVVAGCSGSDAGPATSTPAGQLQQYAGTDRGVACTLAEGTCTEPSACERGSGVIGSSYYGCGPSRQACCLPTCGSQAESFECCNAAHTYAPRPTCEDGTLSCAAGYTQTPIGTCLSGP